MQTVEIIKLLIGICLYQLAKICPKSAVHSVKISN